MDRSEGCMMAFTKAQILSLVSTRDSATATIDNEVRDFAEAAESRGKAFARGLDDALSRGGARFNFAFDYPKNDHARSLCCSCTLNKGKWLRQSVHTIVKGDGIK